MPIDDGFRNNGPVSQSIHIDDGHRKQRVVGSNPSDIIIYMVYGKIVHLFRRSYIGVYIPGVQFIAWDTTITPIVNSSL